MLLGDEGTEQFILTTWVNDEKVGEQKIHDPFIRTTIKLRGLKYAWDALFGRIRIMVSLDGSEGAVRAIMTLNPEQLEAETEKILEQRKQRNTTGMACAYVSNRND